MNFQRGDRVELIEDNNSLVKGDRGIVVAPFMGASVQGVTIKVTARRDEWGDDFFVPLAKLKRSA